MRSVLLSATLLGGLIAVPAARAQDLPSLPPLAPVDPTDPLVPLKPLKPEDASRQRPAKAAPDKHVRPSKLEPARKVDSASIVIRGVPSVPLKPGESAVLTVRVLDSAGKPTPCEISLTASPGTLTAPVGIAPGTFAATYAAPTSGMYTKARIHAEVKNAAAVFAETSVALEAAYLPTEPKRPKPARVVFADSLRTTAGQPVDVRFAIEDEAGNPLAPDGVTLRSEGGELAKIRSSKGAYLAELIPEAGRTGPIFLYAEVGGERLVGEGTVLVSPHEEKESSSRFGFGAFVSGRTNFAKVATPEVDLHVDVRFLGVVRAGVLAGFAPASASSVAEANGAASADFTFRAIPVVGRLSLELPLGFVSVFAGGMAGVAIVRGDASKVGAAKVTFSATPFTITGFAGAGIKLGPGYAGAEIRYGTLPIDVAPERLRLKGNLGGLGIAVGYRIDV